MGKLLRWQAIVFLTICTCRGGVVQTGIKEMAREMGDEVNFPLTQQGIRGSLRSGHDHNCYI